ncbi:UNKNOWN [Stylonychia lemnae]|uniref:Transmembrane protein n=1 Tax=Stylonychia lemnae TaxID=5949 RepID=A0A078AL19_STYLE|nr:UNKNOWN [Stylonychia lemnae]|eukprot:CDW82576.1 UNKNOWN [Stylonychia lemnae]
MITNQINNVNSLNVTADILPSNSPAICNTRQTLPTIVPSTYYIDYEVQFGSSIDIILNPYFLISTCSIYTITDYTIYSYVINSSSVRVIYQNYGTYQGRKIRVYVDDETYPTYNYRIFWRITLSDGSYVETDTITIRFKQSSISEAIQEELKLIQINETQTAPYLKGQIQDGVTQNYDLLTWNDNQISIPGNESVTANGAVVLDQNSNQTSNQVGPNIVKLQLRLVRINQQGELKCSFNNPVYQQMLIDNKLIQESLEIRYYRKDVMNNALIKDEKFYISKYTNQSIKRNYITNRVYIPQQVSPGEAAILNQASNVVTQTLNINIFSNIALNLFTTTMFKLIFDTINFDLIDVEELNQNLFLLKNLNDFEREQFSENFDLMGLESFDFIENILISAFAIGIILLILPLLIVIGALKKFKPFDKPDQNIIEIFNESMVLAIITMSALFLQLDSSHDGIRKSIALKSNKIRKNGTSVETEKDLIIKSKKDIQLETIKEDFYEDENETCQDKETPRDFEKLIGIKPLRIFDFRMRRFQKYEDKKKSQEKQTSNSKNQIIVSRQIKKKSQSNQIKQTNQF